MSQTSARTRPDTLKKHRPPPTTGAGVDSAAAELAWSQGVALARAGRDAQALPHLVRATRLGPAVAVYWLNRAGAERRLRRFDDAVDSARSAFDLDRSNLLSCHMLAELLRLAYRDTEALQVLLSLDPATPRDARHALMEGSLRMAQRDWANAAVAFLQVLAEKPADAEAYMQLGFALANLKRYADASECFRTVTLLEPEQLGAAIYAAHYAAWACDWQQTPDDEQRLRHALAAMRDRSDAPAFSPFGLLAMNDDTAMFLEASRIEAARIARATRTQAAWQPTAAGIAGYPQAHRALQGGKLRVGFVSADFRTHATSLLMVQTLERLDRSRFEITLYSHGPDDRSPLRERVLRAADHVVDCREMIPAAQAARIRADGIALLIDLCGYTANSRLGVFSLRPAPVQASWLAYPGTTGADYIDYIVGDAVLLPLAHAADFSEKLVQLPGCYQSTDELRLHPEPVSRADCGLPEDAFVYATFNQSYKITADVYTRWCRILQRVPGSVLWLLVPQPEIQATLRRHAAAHGIAADRIVHAPFVAQPEHLARLPQADLFLDTFPCGAHTTCNDALWMGLPVLTQIGRSFASRVAASLLHASGMPEWVMPDGAAYEERAVALATTDRAALTACRERLWDERRDLPLFDNAAFTTGLADAFERMVGRWSAGLPPDHLPR